MSVHVINYPMEADGYLWKELLEVGQNLTQRLFAL